MRMTAPALTIAALFALPLVGCESSYQEGEKMASRHDTLEAEAQTAIAAFKNADPSIDRFFKNSAGYAVFGEVAKGGAGVGAAHGDGVVYQNGNIVGYTELSQGSIGLQLGGQVYREIIFFQNASSLSHFKAGHLEFSAQASAVAATSGAAANADYKDGVAVFTIAKEGLMFEAGIGGQQFEYYPR